MEQESFESNFGIGLSLNCIITTLWLLLLPVITLLKSQHWKEDRWNGFFMCLKFFPNSFQLADKYWYKYYYSNLLWSEFTVSHDVVLLTATPLVMKCRKGSHYWINVSKNSFIWNIIFMYSVYRAFTVITYSEGYVTAPYASPVTVW